MKSKTARRRLNKLAWKIAAEKIKGTSTRFIKRAFHREIKALRKDQLNPASVRAFQRFLYILR